VNDALFASLPAKSPYGATETLLIQPTGKLNPHITLACARAYTAVSVAVSCTVQGERATADSPTPSGTVTFSVSAGPGAFSPTSCTLLLSPGSTTTCTTSYKPSGTGSDTRTDVLLAKYAGDSRYGAMTAAVEMRVYATLPL
jgi:hypothetical protein